MEHVSFEVAKAIKEAGYPQESDKVYLPDGVFCNYISHFINYYAAPTYYDVWLWIKREKDIKIVFDYYTQTCTIYINDIRKETFNFSRPMESIKDAIEYLVNKNLLK